MGVHPGIQRGLLVLGKGIGRHGDEELWDMEARGGAPEVQDTDGLQGMHFLRLN